MGDFGDEVKSFTAKEEKFAKDEVFISKVGMQEKRGMCLVAGDLWEGRVLGNAACGVDAVWECGGCFSVYLAWEITQRAGVAGDDVGSMRIRGGGGEGWD